MSAYKIITNGPEFAVIFAHVPLENTIDAVLTGRDWRFYTEQVFATKDAAQVWLWGDLEAWAMLGKSATPQTKAA